MKIGFSKIALAGAISIVSVTSFATPMISVDDHTEVNIPANLNATDWFLNKAATELYVAPPSQGTVGLSHFTATTNIGFCPGLRQAQSSELKSMATISLLSSQLNDLTANLSEYVVKRDSDGLPVFAADGVSFVYEVDANNQLIPTQFSLDLKAAKDAVIESNAQVDMLEGLLNSLNLQLSQLSTAKNVAKSDYIDCKFDAEINDEPVSIYCATQIEAYKDASDAHKDKQIEVWNMQDNIALEEFNLAKAKGTLSQLEDEFSDATARITTMQGTITAQKNQLLSLYTEYGNMFGGQANIAYDTNWDNLIQGFQQANPSYSIRPLLLKSAEISAPNTIQGVNPNSALGLQTGFLWSTLPLFGEDADYTTLGDGTAEFEEVQTGASQTLPAFPQSFSGTAGLSLLNACTLTENIASNATEAEKQAIYNDRFKSYIKPAVAYTYEVRAEFGYKATFNMAQVMEVIEKTTKKTGFFSSSSSHSLEENFSETDAFTIEFFADSSGADELTTDEKAEVTEVVRARLVRQALDAIGRRVINTQPSLPSTNETAATGLSRVLIRTCKYGWGYRCYGGWALYAINGIWGGRSSSSSVYKQTNDVWTTEEVRDGFFIDRAGHVDFADN